MAEALIICRKGRDYVLCPNCQRIIGEIVGVRLIVMVRGNWHHTFPLVAGSTQTCPRCHVESEMPSHDRLIVNLSPRATR